MDTKMIQSNKDKIRSVRERQIEGIENYGEMRKINEEIKHKRNLKNSKFREIFIQPI